MSQKIRIKLKSYDHNLVDKSADKIVKTVKTTGAVVTGPIPLPTHKKIFTVLRSHSALAYLGIVAGYEVVAEAIRDEGIERFIDDLWREEITESLVAPPNTNLNEYARQLKSRYRNLEIRHLLEQIAMDGSQKLPQRILAPLFENLSAGKPYKRLLMVVAAWFRYIERRSKYAQPGLHDPLQEELIRAARHASDDGALAESLLQTATVFGDRPPHRIANELVAILGQIGDIYDTARLEGVRQ